MRRLLLAAAAALLSAAATAQTIFPGAEWTHTDPAATGWSPQALQTAATLATQQNATALMVIHHGAIILEQGDTSRRTELASVRKSLLSALIGIEVDAGHIDLETQLSRLGIDDNPPALTDTEKTATIRMLLQARSGIYHPALYETKAMAAKRPARYSHAPGTFWYYNNWDFNALGAIYEHATKTSIFDALDTKIAKPIGMQDFRPQDGHYVRGPASDIPAYPMRMSARDLARFALLYLNDGAWAGNQIVPAAWVRASTTAYSRSPAGDGYGYLWWLPREGLLPPHTFFAWGAGGQFAFVIPEDDLVVISRVDRDKHLPEPHPTDLYALVQHIIAAGPFPRPQ